MISSGGSEGGSAGSGVFPNRFTLCSGGGASGAEDSCATTEQAFINKTPRHAAHRMGTFRPCTTHALISIGCARTPSSPDPHATLRAYRKSLCSFVAQTLLSVFFSRSSNSAFSCRAPRSILNLTAHLNSKSCPWLRLDCGCGRHRQECLCYFCYNSKVCDERETSKALLCLRICARSRLPLLHGSRSRRLNLSGYVRNLRDGRVEAYAIGTPEQLAKFRAALEHGPRFSRVTAVAEEPADVDPQYADEFVTTMIP